MVRADPILALDVRRPAHAAGLDPSPRGYSGKRITVRVAGYPVTDRIRGALPAFEAETGSGIAIRAPAENPKMPCAPVAGDGCGRKGE